MSVIIDAIEAAKREKARRATQGDVSIMAPVLVPLRQNPHTGSRRRPLVTLAGVGIVLVAIAMVAAVDRSKRPLPAVPALTSTILAEALAADSASQAVQPAPPARTQYATDPATNAAASTRPTQPIAPAVASATSASTPSVPAGDPPESAPIGVRETQQAGRLRVAFERPTRPEVARLFGDAVAAQRAGDAALARRLYESLLDLSPADADALNNLGVLLSAQGEHARALDLLRRATAIAPRNAGIWNNMGTVYREQGKSSDAVAAFRHALTIDPKHAGAKVGLAQQYFAIQALPQAKELLDEVVAAFPTLPEGQYLLAQVLELQGDRAGAVRAYTAFVNAAPARLATHVELVRKRIEALSR